MTQQRPEAHGRRHRSYRLAVGLGRDARMASPATALGARPEPSVLLTISTTHVPATDLGYLLHKHPDRLHAAATGFGAIHVLYPEATTTLCTAALLVEVDPIGLVRDRKGPTGNDFALAQYVNDRPYAASSFLSSPWRRPSVLR